REGLLERDKDAALKEERKNVVCFVYHRFDDKRYPTTNVPLSDFENHLRYLKENNFQVLTLSQAMDYLKSNEPAMKTAVLTIDDGYKTFFTNGLPLLTKYKMPATLFINTKTVGASDFMDWEQLRKVNQSGVEIGNHTHSHNFFLNESINTRYESFEKEITQSQSLIKDNLQVTPEIFTYPYGEFDEKMKEIVKRAGFKCAAAQNSGVLYEGTDPFQIPRFPMSESYSSLKQFVEKSKMLPFQIIKESPDNVVVTKADSRPVLTLKLNAEDLQVKSLKCFIQGSEAEWKIIDQNEKEITIQIQSKSSILKRRRTLYTITAPGKTGQWHWYSRLWINTGVKDE
ncbi:MAG TPA: polysaccharide deacetylase family protein, partial [Cyclobacteriaceae bacterium]